MKEPFLVPGYSGHQPECLDLFRWNSWFYVLFGQDGATHYRMSHSAAGPWKFPLWTFWTLHKAYAFNQYLASRGYVVLSVNYRSGTGYGLNRSRSLHAQPDRCGSGSNRLWGGSYGGYLTALALARVSNLFAVGVDLHSMHDWNSEIQVFAPG